MHAFQCAKYEEYPSEQFPELMIKENRPYTQVITDINGLKFAVPLRSGISHTTDVLLTDKQAKHGLDFTKAVIILDDEYNSTKKSHRPISPVQSDKRMQNFQSVRISV